MTPLSPSQKNVLRVRTAIFSLILIVFALIAEVAIPGDLELPTGIILGLALVASFLLIFLLPDRRYRAWGYDETADELQVQHGIWVRRRTIVPFGRVQHIDVSQGPIERHYRIGTLTLHTAGTRSSAVALPGLDLDQAERMRDEIRGKIRQDLV
ncbi:MAG: PH domain-containing protein [Sphingosinicella sp.]|nr:PH domain-containing protein [Sphingosinicella sp.]